MSNIQIVTNSTYFNKNYTINKLNNNESFDLFDYNIIDFRDQSIWKNEYDDTKNSNLNNDLGSIGTQISNSSKCNFIFIFPMNINFLFGYSYHNVYNKSIVLRDIIPDILNIIESALPISIWIEYEKNKTTLNDKIIYSDFYFSISKNEFENIILSDKSNKVVSFTDNRFTYTTLDILKNNDVELFLSELKKDEEDDYPKWFNDVVFNDDNRLKEEIHKKNNQINQLNIEIEDLFNKLDNNKYYKKLVVENGEKLVNIVFDVLQKLLNVDLSQFIDEKKEDFNFEMDNKIFVGEIKGVNEGIRNSHLSQLENNKQLFLESKNIDDCKGILIINELRKTAPDNREKVDNKQIDYAVKHNLLIITTYNLMKIFEFFLQGQLDLNKFKKLLIEKTGLLQDEWR